MLRSRRFGKTRFLSLFDYYYDRLYAARVIPNLHAYVLVFRKDRCVCSTLLS